MTQRTNLRDVAVTNFEPAGGSPVEVAWPDTESGDRVLLICNGEENGTNDFTPAGSWTSLGKDGVGTGITFQVWQLDGDASGSESGTFDVAVSPTSTDYTFICVSVANPTGSTEAEFATGTSTTPDPPSITPSGGSQHYDFVVGAGMDRNNPILSWPDGYGQWVSHERGTERAAFSLREAVESTEDPGTFTRIDEGWVTATIAIPTTAPDPSNFPVAEGRAGTQWTTDAATQSMNLPADIEAGELLVAEVTVDGATTATIDDWDVVGSQVSATSVGVTLLTKIADGTEGATVTLNLSNDRRGSAICTRISGATIDDLEAVFADNGDTGTPQPPSLTPAGGSAEILWLVGIGSDSNTPATQLFPFGFGADVLQVENPSTLGASMVSGFGAYETATVSPPAAIKGTQEAVTYTVAIYPSAEPPPPPPSGGGNRMGDGRAIRKPPRTPR